MGPVDASLRKSREALLAGRECKKPNSTEPGHLPYKWHICPACHPE